MLCRVPADLSRSYPGKASYGPLRFVSARPSLFEHAAIRIPHGQLSTETSKPSLQPWLATKNFAEFCLGPLNHETLFAKRRIKLGLPIPLLDELWRQLVRDGINDEFSKEWKEFPAMQRATGGHVKSAELRMWTYQKVAIRRLFKPGR